MQWDRKAGRRRIPRHLLVTYLLQEHPEVFYVNPQSLNAHSMLCKQITKEDQPEQNTDPGIRREDLPRVLCMDILLRVHPTGGAILRQHAYSGFLPLSMPRLH